MPFLHLPVQSGSDRVLEAMNRQHGTDLFRDVVARLRQARPDLTLSSDFIVGFPGETEADFAATMDLVRETGFVMAYSFKYSPRPGTPAAVMPGQVPEAEKDARLAVLQDLLNTQQRDFNRATVGKVMPVLLEKPGRDAGQLIGKTPYAQAAYLEADQAMLGRMVDVRIEDVGRFSLRGKILGGSLETIPFNTAAKAALEVRA
jgi:tRNA-2-methylthio-N6-dimethylallyladenosine synthase